MALYFIGLGLYDEKDITLKGLETARKCDVVFAEFYTSFLAGTTIERIEGLIGKPIRLLTREDVELNFEKIILPEAREKDVAFLTAGDPMVATTHADLRIRARKAGVESYVIHAPSIYSAVSVTGLQIYKFGKTVTLVYPEETYKPYSTVETIWFNYSNNLHTLVLLDLRLDEGKAMSIREAVNILLQLEREYARERGRETIVDKAILVGVARAGLRDQVCIAGKAEEVIKGEYPPPPHSLVVVAPKPHPLEVEALKLFCRCKSC
jgi:diphthine synthase